MRFCRGLAVFPGGGKGNDYVILSLAAKLFKITTAKVE